MKKTKIIGTIGPSSESKEVLTQLVKAGLNTIRLNMSHGDYDEQTAKINVIREINSELGTNVAVLLDTKGPEVRTGLFEEGTVFTKGSIVTLTKDDIKGNTEIFTVSYKGLIDDVNVGDIILLDDGYVSIKVTEKNSNDLKVEVLNTGKMKDRRGVNVPGVNLNFEFMSAKDKSDIEWACDNDLDYIAASFVRNANDLKLIQDILDAKGNTNIKIISKIESQEGVENIDAIIEGSDGIMVARGDLGVEVPAEDVPVIQKSIIEKCNAEGKIVVTATQMLESMQDNPRPTRAEVSDVFNAVMDGTDAVMLSGESASGDYPVESVAMQAKIAARAESAFDFETYVSKQKSNLDSTVTDLVAYSVSSTADALENVKLIIATTESGTTARKLSRLKPKTPILALTSDEKVRRSLALNYGVYARLIGKKETTDEIIKEAISQAKEFGIVKAGDEVVISSGSINQKGQTDLMKVIKID